MENKNPNILVDASTRDDAAVYKITNDTCIALTVDFFPPNVDDPYTYGQISAANSMSDIYAMGGDPIIGLNIAAFPKKFPIEIINNILLGAKEKCDEAGLSIIGGHTIYDDEPKYGLAVIGKINCNKIIKNNTAKSGDLLILTKALGTGILTQLIKKDSSNIDSVLKESINSMTMLNKKAAEIIRQTINNKAIVSVDQQISEAEEEDSYLGKTDKISKQKIRCAEIIGKTGSKIGGKDIDQWIVDHFIPGNNYINNLSRAEKIKCKLS